MERDPKAVFFFDCDVQLGLQGYPCVISNSKSSYLKTSLAFGFQKNSPYTKLFSYFILKMRQSGQIEKLYNMHVNEVRRLKPEHHACITRAGECMPNQPNCVPPIGIKTVLTSGLIIVGGVLCGVFILLFERLYDAFDFKKGEKNNRTTDINDMRLKKTFFFAICIFTFLSFCMILIVLFLYYMFLENNYHGDLSMLAQ